MIGAREHFAGSDNELVRVARVSVALNAFSLRPAAAVQPTAFKSAIPATPGGIIPAASLSPQGEAGFVGPASFPLAGIGAGPSSKLAPANNARATRVCPESVGAHARQVHGLDRVVHVVSGG
jgi:hypothetical protein